MKEDHPVVNVAPIQQANEAPIQPADDDNPDLNLSDNQFKDDAAPINSFGRQRSRSNPAGFVEEEEQVVTGATPIQLPARARSKSDLEDWVKTYNLKTILGVNLGATPTPAPAPTLIDTSLLPHLHTPHHVPPSQPLQRLIEIVVQRTQQIINSARDLNSVNMELYHRHTHLTRLPPFMLHETTTWEPSRSHLLETTTIDVYHDNPTSTGHVFLMPAIVSLRWIRFVDRNAPYNVEDRKITLSAMSGRNAPPMYEFTNDRQFFASRDTLISQAISFARQLLEHAASSSTPGPTQRVSPRQFQQNSTAAEQEEEEAEPTRKAPAKRQRQKERLKLRKEAEKSSSESAPVQPQTRKPASIIVPAVPDMDKIKRLLMKRKSSVQQTSQPLNTRSPPLQTDMAVQGTDNSTYDTAKTTLSTSNAFSQLQDCMNEDPAEESKILTSRSPSPDNSRPLEESPAPTAQSSEQIPVMHDSADPAAHTAEGGSVPTGDEPGQPAEKGATLDNTSGMTEPPGEQVVTQDVTSGMTDQPGEQDVTRDDNAGVTDEPREQDATQDNTSGVTDQPGEQDVTEDTTSGTIPFISFTML